MNGAVLHGSHGIVLEKGENLRDLARDCDTIMAGNRRILVPHFATLVSTIHARYFGSLQNRFYCCLSLLSSDRVRYFLKVESSEVDTLACIGLQRGILYTVKGENSVLEAAQSHENDASMNDQTK